MSSTSSASMPATLLNSLVRRLVQDPNSPILLVISVALLVHVPNLLNYPAWFLDEGAYLTYSSQWLQTGQLSYFLHPFGALTILALLFAALNPTSYLVPRILMVLLSAIDGALLYKIAGVFYKKSEGFALVASLLYVATPLSARYLRLVVVDNFMTFFLLLALLTFLSRPKDQVVSPLLFGCALVSKQTALFFIPALLVLFGQQKKPLSKSVQWMLLAAVIPIIWILYATFQIGFSSWLSSQIGLTNLPGDTAVSAGTLIIQRIAQRDPSVFLGLAGLLWCIYKRNLLVAFPLSYLLSFVVLFLRVSTVYLIPMIPFFSIFATVLLFDLSQRIPQLRSLPKIRTYTFGLIVVALIASSLVLVAFQNPATAQQQAFTYVANQHPQGVIVSNTYLWLYRQNYPGITVYDRYFVPWSQLHGRTVYLIVDPGDVVLTINTIPQYHDLYFANSTQATLKTFTDPQSGYQVQVLYGTIP